MVDAVRAWLGEQSVTPANFYYEKFAPSGVLATINEAPSDPIVRGRFHSIG
jgi:benzoate/toluate 1,2-dioxygenase reductase subunit